MTMTRRTALLACAAGALFITSPAQAADTVIIGVIGAGSTVLWPNYIAMEKGFYAKRGIEPDVIVVPSNTAMQQQLSTNSLNIGITGGSPDPIRAVDKGAPN